MRPTSSVAAAILFLSVLPVPAANAAQALSLPPAFEENVGQAPPTVRFLARQSKSVFTIEGSAFTVSLADGNWIRFTFVGASSAPTIRGERALVGTRNYFVGADPQRWSSDVKTWERVRIESLYPGIDVVFRFSGGEVEYDFIVAPGARSEAIVMRSEGTVTLGEVGGRLVGSTARGTVLEHLPPRSFQGDSPVSSAWTLRDNELRFLLGPYDRNAELIIDPTIVTSTYLGGTSGDEILAMTVDPAGNVYVAGETYSTNYPIQGAVQNVNKTPSHRDGFVTKLDPTGRTVLFSTYFGGDGFDIVEDIAVDAAGAVYFTGSGYSLDLPVSADAFQKTANIYSGEDGFLVKLTPSGNAIAYCTYLRANSTKPSFETLRGIAVDATGHAYIVGDTTDPTWPITPGAYRTTGCGGSRDPFVTKVSPDGSSLVYSTYLCGSGPDQGNDIRVDASGNAFVVGTTNSADFPQVGSPSTANREADAWVAKLNPTGSTLLRSTVLSGNRADIGATLALGAGDSVYVAGNTFSTDLPTTSGYQKTYRGASGSCQAGLCGDSYLARFSPELTLLSATYVGGARSDDRITAIAASGTNVVAVGRTESTDYPLFNATQSTHGGRIDTFVSVFDSSLQNLSFSTFLGGGDWDIPSDVAIDADGTISVAGWTLSTNFPTSSAYQATAPSPGDADGFVAKISGAVNEAPKRRRPARR